MEPKLTKSAMKLLKKLAKLPDEAALNFDGRSCRPLLAAKLIRAKYDKNQKRIVDITITKRGLVYAEDVLGVYDRKDMSFAMAVMSEPATSPDTCTLADLLSPAPPCETSPGETSPGTPVSGGVQG